MTLWWLQPEWTETRCGSCHAVIAPEGDPDWGLCWSCMVAKYEEPQEPEPEQMGPKAFAALTLGVPRGRCCERFEPMGYDPGGVVHPDYCPVHAPQGFGKTRL